MSRLTKGGLHRVCVYLTSAEHNKLKALARGNGRALSSESRVRLVAGLSGAQMALIELLSERDAELSALKLYVRSVTSTAAPCTTPQSAD